MEQEREEGGGGGGYWYDCVSAVTARYDEWPADTTVQPNANISIVYTLPSVIHHCFWFFCLGNVVLSHLANDIVKAAGVSK